LRRSIDSATAALNSSRLKNVRFRMHASIHR
jgi:hypothetical protein